MELVGDIIALDWWLMLGRGFKVNLEETIINFIYGTKKGVFNKDKLSTILSNQWVFRIFLILLS